MGAKAGFQPWVVGGGVLRTLKGGSSKDLGRLRDPWAPCLGKNPQPHPPLPSPHPPRSQQR